MKWNSAVCAALVPLLAVAGCVAPPEGDEAENAQYPDPEAGAASSVPGVADRGERGGPLGDGAGKFDVGVVKTEATDGDTVELFTAPSAGAQTGEGGTVNLDWTARLSITFTSAVRSGGDITFEGEAVYLHDSGGYLLHSRDFSVLVPGGESAGPGGDPAAGFTTYTSADAEPLLELTGEQPGGEFSVTISGVPPEDDTARYEDGTVGRYIRYETPETLWGHTTSPPQDYIPGRLCYVEGDGWHDIPLFDYTDMPCG